MKRQRLFLASILALAILIAMGASGPPTASRGIGVLALVDILVVTTLIARRADVRLVLLLGALPLFAAVGKLPQMVVRLAAELSNPATVVPIGAALGFAYVLKLTECDQHLVQLLVRPLRRARVLLVPGGIAAGYVVNSAVVSQTGTAAVIGPILIPLLRAAGVSPVTAGSMLLLGSSMGGELFNPGAVEVRKLAELTGLEGTTIVARGMGLNLLGCGTALLVFWLQSLVRERRASRTSPVPEEGKPFPIQPIKAIVPLLPIVLLFASSTVLKPYVPKVLEGPPTILAAMLIGSAAAALTAPRTAGKLSSAFFEGAGYAYTHVISLIVTATIFAEGIRESGLIRATTTALLPWPSLALFVCAAAPWALAAVSGTGIAPAVSVMEFFVPEAAAMGLDPARLGIVTALGSHFGRTMSPAAAVVMMSAKLSDAPPVGLIRRVVPPLLVGGAVFFLAALARLF